MSALHSERGAGSSRGAAAALAAVVAVGAGQALVDWGFTYWQRDFFDALTQHRVEEFWHQVILLVVWIASVATLAAATRIAVAVLTNRLRTTRFAHLSGEYFGQNRFAALPATGSDPVQRLVDDIREWAADAGELLSGGVRMLVAAVLFGTTLWTVLPAMRLFGLDLPGPMLWFALLVFSIGAALIHAVSAKMPQRETDRANSEGALRAHVARVREYARSIALLDGAGRERERAGEGLSRATRASLALAALGARIEFLGYVVGPSDIFAWLLLSPFYFHGDLTLGQVFQAGMAHGLLGRSLHWAVDKYPVWIRCRAADRRLNDWARELEAARPGGTEAQLVIQSGQKVECRGLRLRADADAESLIRQLPAFSVEAGEKVLLRAPSGYGKSLLLATMSGVWPWAEGRITVPPGTAWMPQRAYFPFAALRTALAYPQQTLNGTQAERLEIALRRVGLAHLLPRLDETADWNNVLSGGELARLSLVRALLSDPKCLVMDEPTAALDAESARAVWGWVTTLDGVTVVAVAHHVEEGNGLTREIALAE